MMYLLVLEIALTIVINIIQKMWHLLLDLCLIKLTEAWAGTRVGFKKWKGHCGTKKVCKR